VPCFTWWCTQRAEERSVTSDRDAHDQLKELVLELGKCFWDEAQVLRCPNMSEMVSRVKRSLPIETKHHSTS